ncbi:hypothetical protein AMECASPLE_002385 [Ameca splendens]|uniref:Secreted protein n=1 Tax=Ameca splendens TaxID=208324 RepID=A0ABV0XM92_9TELE
MRQHSTAPLLAVILAAVRSGGKGFSQSLASHTICLPDTQMKCCCLHCTYGSTKQTLDGGNTPPPTVLPIQQEDL